MYIYVALLHPVSMTIAHVHMLQSWNQNYYLNIQLVSNDFMETWGGGGEGEALGK